MKNEEPVEGTEPVVSSGRPLQMELVVMSVRALWNKRSLWK